ncbi:MAG: zinc dependent phospholipase C family protein [Deltaproteobacteria bacterium]|nr:zinc dependent phospholipase C family protein [Deltaproteobacteria bacterium]
MPFENTHLHLADKVRQKLQGDALAAALKEHLAYYYLGSVFPDILFYLSGYRPDANQKEKQRSFCLHWKYETLMDSRLNTGFSLEACVHERLVKDLIVPEILGIEVDLIVKVLKKQRRYFSKIRSRSFFWLYPGPRSWR